MNKKILARFDELEKDIDSILHTKYVSRERYSDGAEYIDNKMFIEWCQKVKSLIILSAGEDSMYYETFIREQAPVSFGTNYGTFEVLTPIFKALKNDYENGFLDSIRSLITAEVFDSELEQAQELLDNKYHVAAAVIAGVVLETGLRELCDTASIAHGKLDKMNADLTKAGVYNKLQQKKITSLSDIRNSAAHGKTAEFTHDDVQSMIRDIESFLANHLSD